MQFPEIYVDQYENATGGVVHLYEIMRLLPGARIYKSTITGPLYLNKDSQVGPDVVAGKYFGMNASCYIARGSIGAYCSIGARTSINPFSHPIDWLSTNEFQYHPNSFDWVEEYRDFTRLERTPDMYRRVTVGNDVWTGHHVHIMGGVTVGDGAVIAAGTVVTKDVPPYAMVAGVPGVIKRFRFPEKTIEKLLRLKWWELDLSELSGLPFRDVDRCADMIEDIRRQKLTAAKANAG